MNKNKYALLRTAVITLALLCMLSACDMGYDKNATVYLDATAPVIIRQPQGTSVDLDDITELSIIAALPEGVSGTLKYQWYRHLTYRAYQDQAGIRIKDATESTFTPPTETDGEYNYYVVVSNESPYATGRRTASIKSAAVTVTVNDPRNARYPVITSQPSGASLTWSPRIALPTLQVSASIDQDASDELRYQWYVTDTLTNTQGIAIEGAITSSLIPPMTAPGQEAREGWISGAGNYYYFVVVTNYFFRVAGRRESSVASNPVLVSIGVNPDAVTPVIKGQPENAIYFNGDAVIPLILDVEEPEDGGALSYQWFSNITSSTIGGILIPGAVSASYSPPISTDTPDKYYFYSLVTNTNEYATTNPSSTVASRVAELTVTTPANRAADATFTVLFGGTNQYQYVRGFGGMDVAWGNFPNYSVGDYENMFNPEILGYNMIRLMILPTYTDINRTLNELVNNQIYTTMERQRFYENVKTVNRYGGYVLASPWSPPAAWKTNNSINGGGDLRESDYRNYANYLRAFAQNMLNNGAPVYAISIQNEPNYTAGYDGCEWTGIQMRNFYRDMGRFTEGVAGYGGGKIIPSVKTMNGESANTTTINEAVMSNAAARRSVDLLGRHNYGSRNENGAGTGATPSHNWIYRATEPKEIWMTEHNLNSNSGITYPNDHTWNYVWLFMNDVDMTIRINHESAFIWWSAKRFYSMIGDGTYGCADNEILPRGWGLAHYAKFAKESYRVGVSFSGRAVENVNVNGNRYEDFTSETVKVSAFMKLRDGEVYPVNWRNQEVPIEDITEITMVMFTPTAQTGSGGYDMGTVRLQLPPGFRISSATAMRSDPVIFDRNNTNRGTPRWETVDITADRNAAFVRLPISTILSVRFTQ
jgi:O-glycosyl hydrolase